MKLCQKIVLTNALSLRTFLTQEVESDLVALNESCSLSFHPYLLRPFTEDEKAFAPLVAPLRLSLDLVIFDDEQKKPLLENLSGNRSLLLISEIIHGLVESLEVFGLEFTSIIPREHDLRIAFSTKGLNHEKSLIGALMMLKTAIEALLFVRGLVIGHAQLITAPSVDQKIKAIIDHIFYERMHA